MLNIHSKIEKKNLYHGRTVKLKENLSAAMTHSPDPVEAAAVVVVVAAAVPTPNPPTLLLFPPSPYNVCIMKLVPPKEMRKNRHFQNFRIYGWSP